jgi:hypothetical protein
VQYKGRSRMRIPAANSSCAASNRQSFVESPSIGINPEALQGNCGSVLIQENVGHSHLWVIPKGTRVATSFWAYRLQASAQLSLIPHVVHNNVESSKPGPLVDENGLYLRMLFGMCHSTWINAVENSSSNLLSRGVRLICNFYER